MKHRAFIWRKYAIQSKTSKGIFSFWEGQVKKRCNQDSSSPFGLEYLKCIVSA